MRCYASCGLHVTYGTKLAAAAVTDLILQARTTDVTRHTAGNGLVSPNTLYNYDCSNDCIRNTVNTPQILLKEDLKNIMVAEKFRVIDRADCQHYCRVGQASAVVAMVMFAGLPRVNWNR